MTAIARRTTHALERHLPELPSRAPIEDAVAGTELMPLPHEPVPFVLTAAGRAMLAHPGNDTAVCPWCDEPIDDDDLVAPVGGRLVHNDGPVDAPKGCYAEFVKLSTE